MRRKRPAGAARVGANRFLFPGRVDRRLLRPGTYRLAAEIDGVRAASPTFRVVAAASQSASGESRTPRTLVVLLVLLAIPLLAVAALPGRLVPGSRAAELLAAGRLGLTAAGFAALAAASAPVRRHRALTLDVLAARPTV